MLTLLLAERRYQQLAAAASGQDKDGDEDDISYNHVSDYAPFFEIDAHWQSSSSKSDDSNNKILAESIRENHERLGRRVFNTHLRWDMLPKIKEGDASSTQIDTSSDNETTSDSRKDDNTNNHGNQTTHTNNRPQCGKFIYITRNQIDVVASFYHHLSNQKEGTYTESFTTFVRDWMEGKIPFGSSLHHLIGFAEGFADNVYDGASSSSSSSCGDDDDFGCNNDNTVDGSTSNNEQPLLLLSYEQLKSNLQSQVERIITFLNLTHIPQHVLEDEILPSFEFNDMKRNIDRFQPKSVGWLNGFQFLRRGVTGDGRKLLLGNSESGEDEEESDLMKEYVDWVESEGYCSKIESLLDGEGCDE